MNKWVVLAIKILVMVVVVAVIAWKVRGAWAEVGAGHVAIDWRWGGIAVVGFCGSMLTSGMVWRWLAWKMGDRSPTVPLIGAYTYSQMGKYFPGKVALVLMRIERTGRFGMRASVCTLSTLLENALYMISGSAVGMVAILRVTAEMEREGKITAAQQMLVWPVVVVVMGVLAAACWPPVFYGLVNRVMRKMKKPEVPSSRQLKVGSLAMAVVGFVPCWLFGGTALWAAARCVHEVEVGAIVWFAGAYALSVVLGMASFLPGGLVVRDGILGAAVTMQLVAMGVGHNEAVLLGAVAAGLQRVFQILVEVLLGLSGMGLTGGKGARASSEAVSNGGGGAGG